MWRGGPPTRKRTACRSCSIVGLDVSDVPALRASLRIDSGVLVTARTQADAGNLVPLTVGDVIHAVDTIPVRSLDGLRVLLDGRPPNSDVVLQVNGTVS